MDKNSLRQLLEQVKLGDLEVVDALDRLKSFPYDDLGFAKLDTHRDLRRGFPEVIFCKGKTIPQVVRIFQSLSGSERQIMATRSNREFFDEIQKVCPEATYSETAKIILAGRPNKMKTTKRIAVISAGTADISVAEEAAVTAEAMGNPVDRLFDVGVAGIHRLFDNKDTLFKASVIIVVAGMEGALASVVGGMVDCPVIAVPTSIGYGASFHGLAALLSMLNCCSPGVAVMNIDNGFGAGYFAAITNLGND
ncbi:MAG: nickel pincer cofactor biosynthesis protein LarB [candidate division Zixibacteria bacterium]|nr:nickel pincer cofactor biosynthesis protein LarB [candidate division Zixibacteria bacterium]